MDAYNETPEIDRLIARIRLINLVLILIGGLICLAIADQTAVLGFIIGGLLSVINLAVLVFLLKHILMKSKRNSLQFFLFAGKFLALLFFVYCILKWLPLDTVAFVCGFSLFIVAMMIGGLGRTSERT